jgi:hypothetical protein
MSRDLASGRPHGFLRAGGTGTGWAGQGPNTGGVPRLEETVAILVPIRLPDQFGFASLRLDLYFGYARLTSHGSEYIPLEFSGLEAEAAERQLKPYSDPRDMHGYSVTGVVR